MRESRKADEENKKCDICGATGFRESLVACFRCKQACEHVYCMRTNRRIVPKVWFCEACQLQKKSTLKAENEACQLQKKSTLKAENDPVKLGSPLRKSIEPFPRNSLLKGVETGKVKYIPAEEAIMLTFGTERKTVTGSCPHSGPSDNMTSISKRTSLLSTAAPSKYVVQTEDTTKTRSLQTQPPCGDRLPNHKPSLGEKLELYKVEGREAPAEADERPCSSSPSIDSLSTRNAGGASLNNLQDQKSVQEKALAVFSPRFEEDHDNLPALDCTWRGSFEIVNMSSSSQFYDGFRAHPPGKVSRKAYEFSKKLPGILQFKLQNHSDVWAEVFDSYSPAGSDIALYFFPGDFERSIQMYNNLCKHLEVNDFAVRSCLEGVELLIFTSKHLPLDSRINMELYLWGVFHRVKGSKVLHTVLLSSSQFLPGDTQGYKSHSLKYDSKDKSKGVDMNMDMIGGKDVGSICYQACATTGGRQSLHIPQVTDVQFQSQSQPPLFTHTNVITNTVDELCKRSDGSTSMVLGPSKSSSLFLPGNTQGYKSHSLKYDSKDKSKVVDMNMDMIGGKDVGSICYQARATTGVRQSLHIPQVTDVQFQSQSQPPLFTHSNVITNTVDELCKQSDGSTLMVLGPSKSSSLFLPGNIQGYNSHSLNYDSKDNPEVVDIDMIGGKDVGSICCQARATTGGRQSFHIPQGTDVQFQLQSQPPLFTHSNVITKAMDGSCKRGDGSTSGACGSSDWVVEPPLNVILCAHPRRPNEVDTIPQNLLEVKRETYLDVPPGFSRQVISRATSDRLLKKPKLEPNISGNVDVVTPQVGKEDCCKEIGAHPGFSRQFVREARHGGSLGIPQALTQLKMEDCRDLDVPPGFSRPVTREASHEGSLPKSQQRVDIVSCDLTSRKQPQKTLEARLKHHQVPIPGCTMDSKATELTHPSAKQKRLDQS